jgi:hypothetical protein
MFEAGTAVGAGRTVVPVIVDDLPFTEVQPPLSMFIPTRFSDGEVATLLDRIAGEIGLAAQMPEAVAALVRTPNPALQAPGLWSGGDHLDLRTGWVPYGSGNPRSLKVHRDHVAIGNSYDDSFRYPPADTLTAPWRTFGFRLRHTGGVWIYPVFRLMDGSMCKIIASSAFSTWGFTGSEGDEYRVPLGTLPKNRWLVAWIDVQSVERDFPARIQHLAGVRARGPLWISHIWCVDSPDAIPAEYRDSGREFRYPR